MSRGTWTLAPEAAMQSPLDRKPRDDEIDTYGLTHVGKVRSVNQDHFLICSLRRQVVVGQCSFPGADALGTRTDRVAFLAMVADGVGGSVAGEEASKLAIEAVTEYVNDSLDCYYAGGSDSDSFAQSLHAAAMRCHARVLGRAEAFDELRGMATTLTLWLGVWPRAYLLQVGDTRAYLLRGGELLQLSRDQTMAQELVDLGVLPRVEAAAPQLAQTLSSAIGGPQTAPTVTCLTQQWGDVGLLCSDGLTRHVSDDRIRERLRTIRSARETCEALVQDALDGGGSDNVTVLVGRTVPSPAR
jgi:protein phosphatase